MTASNASVAREFDAKAREYERNRLAGWYKAQSTIALDSLGDAPVRGAVLDIGCGTGWFLRRLLQHHPEASGIGIDLSGGMIDAARRHAADEGIDRAVFVQGDWDDAGVVDQVLALSGDTPVQAIVCASAFHYFQDPAAAVARMRACLADGGDLIIVERARHGSMLTGAWAWAHRHLIRDHVRFHDEQDLIGLLRGAGFDHARIDRRLRRYLWHRKLYTSIAIIRATARRAGAPRAAATPPQD